MEPKLLRVVDKTTLLFIRDDFTFNAETELGIDASPQNDTPFIQRKWDMVKKVWVEASGATV